MSEVLSPAAALERALTTTENALDEFERYRTGLIFFVVSIEPQNFENIATTLKAAILTIDRDLRKDLEAGGGKWGTPEAAARQAIEVAQAATALSNQALNYGRDHYDLSGLVVQTATVATEAAKNVAKAAGVTAVVLVFGLAAVWLLSRRVA